jgi:hypothetical protein
MADSKDNNDLVEKAMLSAFGILDLIANTTWIDHIPAKLLQARDVLESGLPADKVLLHAYPVDSQG